MKDSENVNKPTEDEVECTNKNCIHCNRSTSNTYLQFYEACKDESADTIILTDLWTLGDTVEELTSNIKYALTHGKKIVTVTGMIIYVSDKEVNQDTKGFCF